MTADLDEREHTRGAPESVLASGQRARLLGGDRNRTKARVYLVEEGGREVVVKTSEGSGAIARWLLRRESKLLARMPRMECIPEVITAEPGRLVTAWVPGRDLFDFRKRGLSGEKADAVRKALATLHDAGFAHGDIGRHDLVFGADGSVVFLDFATGVGPGCPPLVWRLLLPLWKRIDRRRVGRVLRRYRKIREERREARRAARGDRRR